MNASQKPRIRYGVRDGKLVPVRAYYEGATTRGRMRTKGANLSGINTAVGNSLETLQSRSRNAIANNAYAKSAKETYVSNLIGTGIKPQWSDPRIQNLWDRWVKECDAEGVSCFYGLQSLAAGAQFESGEVLGRFRFRRLSDGLSVPLQLQVMESDHLDPTFNKQMENGHQIKMGIEFDLLGKRSAYHLWRNHPRERLGPTMNTRVPVNADDIVHLYHRTRPGQIRGLPELTSVIVRLYEIDEMQDALLARQKLAQLFGAFVKRKTTHDPTDEGPHFGTLVQGPGEEEGISEFVPGGIHYLEDDEEVSFSNPPDIGAHYTPWIRSELLAIARGAGVTAEQLTGDLSQVNYSSIRAGLLEFRRRMEALQMQLLVHQWCQRIAEKWLDTAVASGALKWLEPNYSQIKSDLLNIDWIPQKWDWVDPLKEVTAALLEVRSGFKPRTEAAGERGWSLEQLDKEIQKANASADEHGLVLDSDPRITQKNGAIQSALNILAQDEEDQ